MHKFRFQILGDEPPIVASFNACALATFSGFDFFPPNHHHAEHSGSFLIRNIINW